MIAQGYFGMLAPELILTAGAAATLLIGLAATPSLRRSSSMLAFVTVLAALIVAWSAGPPVNPQVASGLRLTTLTFYIRFVALSVGLLVLLIHWHLPGDDERGDMFAMILFSLTGILLTAAADDLVLLFLAIELVSVPTYILVSIGRGDIRAQEAGVKYFFLGAMSAALLVYGFSFLYGAGGTLSLSALRLDPTSGYATIGLLLTFAGLAFKIAAAPFHLYAADVYQGAASPVSGLLGFFPKISGFIAAIKVLSLLPPPGLTTASGVIGWAMPDEVFWFLWVVAAATMTIGNVLGLMQTNVKRILGYSSISHSGYLLIALLVGPVAGGGPLRDGITALMFYIVVYGVMNLGAFTLLAMLQARNKAIEELDDLAGLAWRGNGAGWLALGLAICVFSLMGMPPTAGFFGKLYIFTGALSVDAANPHHTAMIVLAVVGVLNSAIAAAYYLRIVAACFLRQPETPVTLTPRAGRLRIGLLCCCLVVLLVGLWPRGLMLMSGQTSMDLRASAVGTRTVQADAGNPDR